MNLGAFVNRFVGSMYFQALRSWHRFDVDDAGKRRLASLGPAIVVAYHGRAIADHLLMLKALMGFDLGQPSYALAPEFLFKVPYVCEMAESAGFIPSCADKKELAANVKRIIDRGLKLIVTPGRYQEAWSGRENRYQTKWASDLDYMTMALDNDIPIVPLAVTGVDHRYYPVFDAYALWQEKKAKLVERFPFSADLIDMWQRWFVAPGFWLGIGMFGVWPFTLPLPVRVRQYVGETIDRRKMQEFVNADPKTRNPKATVTFDPKNEAHRDVVRRRVVAQVQNMLASHLEDGGTAALPPVTPSPKRRAPTRARSSKPRRKRGRTASARR